MNLSTVDAFKHLKASDAIELDQDALRRLQLTLVGIQDDIVACCEKHGLTYMLGGGTALGAVRHSGFIPWDDDIDINMPRKDYEAFTKAFAKEYGEKYWLHTPSATKNYGLALARVRLKGTSVRTREDLANKQTECGAFVDIFIIENTFDNVLLRMLHGAGSLMLGFLYSCRKFFFERRFVRQWARENGGFSLSFRLKMIIGCALAALPLGFWVALWDKWNGICRNQDSRYVTIPVGRRHFFGELALRAETVETREVTFEGRKVKCPAGLENYMTRLYGPDYMTPPPEDKREKHVVFEPFVLTGDEA